MIMLMITIAMVIVIVMGRRGGHDNHGESRGNGSEGMMGGGIGDGGYLFNIFLDAYDRSFCTPSCLERGMF